MTIDARQIITSVEATKTSELICLQRTRASMSLMEGGEGERRLDFYANDTSWRSLHFLTGRRF